MIDEELYGQFIDFFIKIKVWITATISTAWNTVAGIIWSAILTQTGVDGFKKIIFFFLSYFLNPPKQTQNKKTIIINLIIELKNLSRQFVILEYYFFYRCWNIDSIQHQHSPEFVPLFFYLNRRKQRKKDLFCVVVLKINKKQRERDKKKKQTKIK